MSPKPLLMNKNLILLLLLSFCIISVFSQPSQNTIQYKNGFQRLNKVFVNKSELYTGIRGGTYSEITHNRFFNVVMRIGTDGNIDSILIISVMDSVEAPLIIDAIKSTRGNWINKSGMAQLVVLPLYLLYLGDYDETNVVAKIPIMRQEYYTNWNKSALIYLDPIIIKTYPSVH